MNANNTQPVLSRTASVADSMIQPEPQDARLIDHIRTWIELNRIRQNRRDAKRTIIQKDKANGNDSARSI